MARHALIYLTVFVILVGTGLLHGYWTDRWTNSYDPGAITKALEQLPVTIGQWEEDKPKEVKDMDKVLDQMMSGPHLLRYYVNRLDGSSVILFLVADRHGPLLVNHTPDGCFRDNGYEQVGDLLKHAVPVDSPATTAEFMVGNFSKKNAALPTHERAFWSWSGSGSWRIPQHPRLAFARHRVLYKLTVVHTLKRPTEPLEGDPALTFIQALVPVLDKHLFGKGD